MIDPVRFISNPSSGKMGIAMALAARELGGDVTLLHGPLSVDLPKGIQARAFTTADELFDLVKQESAAGSGVDVVIMSAAVSDFKPDRVHDRKIKKESGLSEIHLKPNPDILAWLGQNKKEGQVLIGFAMETDNLEDNARTKLKKKNLDWICANDLLTEGAGFQSDENRILLLGRETKEEFRGAKRLIARQILARVFAG